MWIFSIRNSIAHETYDYVGPFATEQEALDWLGNSDLQFEDEPLGMRPDLHRLLEPAKAGGTK